ncbi:tRNA (N6-isopentenyl adenosine(37)-C2)-methylthiotransferase MiaB [Acidobacteriota bacterium]
MSQALQNKIFHIHTFGCQMNENDSERIAGFLVSGGAEPANKIEDSDIIIINTCAVRQKSEEKLFSLLGRLAHLKKQKPLIVGVAGCVSQLYRSELLDKNSVIDFVLGPDNYWQIQDILEQLAGEKIVATAWSKVWHAKATDKLHRKSSITAYITIMEGCNNFCSYCVVPYTRGREKYRPASHIIKEIKDVSKKGFMEIQLLGQNVNTYKDPDTHMGFNQLLHQANEIQGIRWIRFLTSHPKDFNEDIAIAMKESSKICHQLHLPVQSGSSAILKKMNRGYTKEEYLGKIDMIRGHMPDMSFSTDIIVGYPDEEEEDFLETLSVLEQVRFTNIFSFRYSPRPLTVAAKKPDSVPFEIKKRRLIEVQARQKRIQMESNRKLIGCNICVLALGKSRKDTQVFSGRNEAFQVVNFKATNDVIGHFVQVKITSCGPYSLRGIAV